MSFRLRSGHRIFVFSEYVDLRAGFNKLSMLVRERIKANMLDGDLYLFLGKNRKKLKGICYDGTGLLLIAKHLENGCFMRLEKIESLELTVEELDELLRGSYIKRRKFGEEALTHQHEEVNVTFNGASERGKQHRSSETLRLQP